MTGSKHIVHLALVLFIGSIVITVKLFISSCHLQHASANIHKAPNRNPHQAYGVIIHDPGHDTSCRRFYLLNTTKTNWSFLHCPNSNVFLISSTNVRYAAMTLRLVGPKLIYTSLSRPLPGGHGHVLPYKTNFPGVHAAYIRLLVDQDHFDIARNCRTNLTHVNYTFAIDSTDVGSRIGLWEWETAISQSNYSTYIDHDDPHPFKPHMPNSFKGIYYNYPYLDLPQMLDCVKKAVFCFIGDSQMRHMYDAAMELLKGSHDTGCTKQNKTCSAMPELHYFAFRYGHEWASVKPTAVQKKCTHILINFGQWPLGWTEPQPWTYQRYRDALETLFNHLSEHPAEVQIFWISTSPLPYLPKTTSCPPCEWRFPHIVQHYNGIAELMLERFPRLQYVDVFDMIFHMFDVSYDSAHYRHPIQPFAIKYVLTHTCMSHNNTNQRNR